MQLRDLDDETIAELHDAWLDHKVLFFRDQELTRDEHVAYGSRWGSLEQHPFTPNEAEHPEIVVLESTPEQFIAAEHWHSDVTWRACPSLGSILRGIVIPPVGGDTCWANMELAYEQLPDRVKEQIEGKFAVHSFVKVFGRRLSEEDREQKRREFPDQLHPVVRTHPETGQTLAVRERAVHDAHRRHGARRVRASARRAVPAGVGAAVPVPLPVAAGQRRAVGQPLHPALRGA